MEKDKNQDLRFDEEQRPVGFEEVHPTITESRALAEADRCLYCYEAPCRKACPTQIDVPGFIHKIRTKNYHGSAMNILETNIMGGTCARVCPVEILCEKACNRSADGSRPVTIGKLQRFVLDQFFDKGKQPFKRAKPTGKKVAIVGSGPAGLTCAHSLSRLGHEVTIFESKPKPGGLNEYGVAPYKVGDGFVQKEIDFILSVGGIKLKCSQELGSQFLLTELRKKYDAVFLGIGLGGVNALQLEGETFPSVIDAIEYISKVRQAKDLREIPVGKKVVVVGGGSTAIDVAVQTKMMGAEDVTLVYRRGQEEMRATEEEQKFAKVKGVYFKTWSRPSRILGNEKGASAIEFEKTQYDDEKVLVGTGETYTLETDMVFKAIGQLLIPSRFGEGFEMLLIKNGQIKVNEVKETSLPGVFAGGDCINGGKFTVTAVQDGKIAAGAIHQKICGGKD